LTVVHDGALLSGMTTFTVTADAGALIGLSVDGELLGSAEATGMPVNVAIPSQLPGVDLTVTVTKQNYYRYEESVPVIPPAGPFVIHQSHQINDTQMGNGDGLLDYTEDVTLSLTLLNVGNDPSQNAQATISTGDTYVTLLDDTEAYGDIPAGGTATMTDGFELVAAEDIPDGHVVPFTVTVTDNDSTYTSYFSITAHAPDLALAGYDILDGENGVLDPGETADLEVTLHNAGSSAVNDLDLTLTSLGEFVTVTSDSAQIASVAPGGSETATFTVVADSETPIGQVAEFNLDVSATHYAYNTSFATTVGLSIEDFESGFFVSYPWEMSGNAPWLITSSGPYEGSYCAVSGDISDNQSSQMSVTFEVMAPGTISFYYKVSSESSYDYLHFYIDSNEQGSWSGTVGWTPASYPVSAGLHTFRWVYDKDGSVSTGSDCGWVDYIVFPAVGPQPFPSATCAPSSFEVTVAPQDSLMQAITLGNVGEADLNFSCSVVYDEKSEQTRVPTLNLKKDVEDRRDGEAPGRGSGGPDPYGYTWVDSDEPGGPTYQWVEINGVGTALQSADDANYGPFPLGFTFQYYGVNYTQIRICTNGFVSFTSTSTSYTNQGIPNSAQPNDMLAPFWDDLNTNYGGTIYYYADTANQRFIVEWDAVSHYSPSGTLETFEVILYADGRILYEYKTLSLGTSCSVGIEDAAGTTGLQVVYNAAYLHSDLSIVFRRPTPWVWVDPMSGTIAPQATAELGVEFNTMDVEIGDYSGTINLTTNDPEHPLMSIPVILHVRDDLSAVDESLPTVFALGSAHPNPFNPMTTIEFAVPQASRVQLRVYDLAGRLVRTLVNEEMTAGVHAVVWNGQDQGGRQVASGAYYYRLTAPGFSETEKMVLIK
jgi:hypothetical protein